MWVFKEFLLMYVIWTNVRGQDPPFEQCPNALVDQETVNAEIYINGGSENDNIFLGFYCYARSAFTNVALTVNFYVGAEVEEKNGELTCRVNTTDYNDCSQSLRYACASKLVVNFDEFLCCTMEENMSFDLCVKQYGIEEDLNNCLNGQISGVDPYEIIQTNANARKNYNTGNDREAFMIFNGVYDSCTSNQAAGWWAKTVCSMLTQDSYVNQPACVKEF